MVGDVNLLKGNPVWSSCCISQGRYCGGQMLRRLWDTAQDSSSKGPGLLQRADVGSWCMQRGPLDVKAPKLAWEGGFQPGPFRKWASRQIGQGLTNIIKRDSGLFDVAWGTCRREKATLGRARHELRRAVSICEYSMSGNFDGLSFTFPTLSVHDRVHTWTPFKVHQLKLHVHGQ